MATTAQIEEREPDPEKDGCLNCGADDFIEVRGDYICTVCNQPYGELPS